jgi:hypothetical protein
MVKTLSAQSVERDLFTTKSKKSMKVESLD